MTARPAGLPGTQAERHSEILQYFRSGAAQSRADVARLTGVSPSTASSRVDQLVKYGFLVESGPGESTGGRRPRTVSFSPSLGTVAGVELGASHARVALADSTGAILSSAELPITISDGPHAVLSRVRDALDQLRELEAPPLLTACVGVPGPVGPQRNVVMTPSRMPGWNSADVSALGEELLGVPTIVENDANLIALGARRSSANPHTSLVAVKIGSGIGCGVIVDGALYRGPNGMAGDISHTTVPGAAPVPCSCGRTGCLEVVASGAALAGELATHGIVVKDTQDMLTLIRDSHPIATNLLREAGERVGTVLATITGFFNPDTIVLGGHISASPAFVQALKSTIYASCLPMSTAKLEFALVEPRDLNGIHGAIAAALDFAFTS